MAAQGSATLPRALTVSETRPVLRYHENFWLEQSACATRQFSMVLHGGSKN